MKLLRNILIIIILLIALPGISMEKEDPESIDLKSLLGFSNLNLAVSATKPTSHAIHSLRQEDLDFGLISSIARKDRVSIQLYLNNRANPNSYILTTSNDGDQTAIYPLLVAVSTGSREIVALLLECGADVDIQTSHALQAIHMAATSGYNDIIELLIDKGADLNATTQVGNSVHLSAMFGHIRTLEILARNKANLDAFNDAGLAPMHCAIEEYKGDETVKVAMVKLLIKYGADVCSEDKTGRQPIIVAIVRGLADVLEVLAANGANLDVLDSFGAPPLHYVIATQFDENIKTKMISCLLNYGANIHIADQEGQQAIHYAAHGTSRKIIELLVENGADLNATTNLGYRPLGMAQESKQNALASFIKQKIESNKQPIRSKKNIKKGNPATPSKAKKAEKEKESGEKEEPIKQVVSTCKDIKDAIEKNDIDALRLFLKRGVKVNEEVRLDGGSAVKYIDIAAMHGNIEAAKVLVERGAKLGVAIHNAARNGQLNFIKWLITKGADIRASGSSYTNTWCDLSGVGIESTTTKVQPIHFAAMGGQLEVVKWFVEQGVSIATQDAGGNQPIHWAAVFGHTTLIDWLIANDADLQAKNKLGKHALDIAKWRARWSHDPAMVDLVKKHGWCVIS